MLRFKRYGNGIVVKLAIGTRVMVMMTKDDEDEDEYGD